MSVMLADDSPSPISTPEMTDSDIIISTSRVFQVARMVEQEEHQDKIMVEWMVRKSGTWLADEGSMTAQRKLSKIC